MNNPAIECRNLAIGYRKHRVAEGISLALYPATVTALLGPNGVGKSTLIKTLTGELRPLEGEVKIFGKPIEDYSGRELSRLLAIVTTDSVLAGGLRLRELVELGRQPHTGFLGILSAADRESVERAMKAVGICHKAADYVAELSDGERQKAMIAKALAQDTPIIVLDEPFSFLDVASRVEILALLNQIARKGGKCILYSSHDVSQAIRMTPDLILFAPSGSIISGSSERLIEQGSINKLFDNRNVVFSQRENDFVYYNPAGEADNS